MDGDGRPITETAVYQAKTGECDGQPYYVEYPLPAYGVAVFKF